MLLATTSPVAPPKQHQAQKSTEMDALNSKNIEIADTLVDDVLSEKLNKVRGVWDNQTSSVIVPTTGAERPTSNGESIHWQLVVTVTY